MNLVLLGPPGSGKGTVGAALAEQLGMIEFDAGSHLRQWASGDLPEQQALAAALAAGEFAPTDLVMRLYREWVIAHEAAGRAILSSGIPRGDQADHFLRDLEAGAYGCDGLLWLDAPTDALVARLSGRRTCIDCQAIYHVVHAPPCAENACDACGGTLQVRPEDACAAATRRRIDLYHERTAPVRERLRAAGVRVVDIDASTSPDRVIGRAKQAASRLGVRAPGVRAPGVQRR
jgi:adenylate kinase